MPANYVLLEKITVGSAGASSVTFSGIPQTGYTDLKVVASVRSSSSYGGADSMVDDLKLIFNGSTASNYSSRRLAGDGSGLTSTTFTSRPAMEFFYIDGSGATASTFGNTEIYIPNYTSSANKSLSAETVGENNATKAYMNILAGLWSNSSAITSMTFSLVNGNFVQYTTFYLYGVAALGTTPAIVPYATGGDTIMTDGTYWYHAFKASGTFTPAKGLSCDVLVVAGGGGGGYANSGQSTAGGAGAGGLRYFAAQAITTATSITVGAGGAGAVSGGAIGAGTAGGNSVFTSYTSAGGAGGFSADNGGSGSGQRNNAGAGGLGNVPATTPSQGNNGGPSAGGIAGGGGGAGAAATDQNGGIGVNTYSTWATATQTGVSGYYAGGGGGHTNGTGGTGGGANASTGSSANAIANTGGGGGASQVSPSGNGGSGIVIVRYAV
jgi:hypothetical protein